MRKIFTLVSVSLLSCLLLSCDFYSADETGSFPKTDYSSLVFPDSYRIDSSTEALSVLNLFYDTWGYGEFEISGTATHTESAVVMGEKIEKSISCKIEKIKIYYIDKSTSGMTVNTFYVDLYNEKNEILSYCYEWQHSNTNAWKNNKTCNFSQASDWYKQANDKQKTAWNIVITR